MRCILEHETSELIAFHLWWMIALQMMTSWCCLCSIANKFLLQPFQFHKVWGQLMKTGYQNSRFAHQVKLYLETDYHVWKETAPYFKPLKYVLAFASYFTVWKMSSSFSFLILFWSIYILLTISTFVNLTISCGSDVTFIENFDPFT